MNNKGYTLVEVLAVIAILSILSGVAVTGVSKYLVKSRQQAYDYMASSAYDAAASYILKEGIPSDGQVSFSELISSGYLKEVVDPKTKEKSCSCSDNDNCNSYVEIQKLSVSDTNTLDDYKYIVHIRCSSGYSKDYNMKE